MEQFINQLEQWRWPEGVVSPFDTTSIVYRCKNHKYKCKSTGKYFTVLTGTPLQGTRIDLSIWMDALQMQQKQVPITPQDFASKHAISIKTAYRVFKILKWNTYKNQPELQLESWLSKFIR